jgi:hypothetical protein
MGFAYAQPILRYWSTEEAIFAVLMTVLVGAIFSVMAASIGPLNDFGD